MVQEWWWIYANDWCWWLPMAMRGDSLMIAKSGAGIIDRVVMVCRSVVVDKLMFSIVTRVCFAYEFRSIWNSNPSGVWLLLFWRGYKCRPRINVDNNQSNTSLYIYSTIYFFDDFINLRIFLLLRVLMNSSSQPRRVLEFRVNTSWPWHPGASLLSGPKYSSYHLCRL